MSMGAEYLQARARSLMRTVLLIMSGLALQAAHLTLFKSKDYAEMAVRPSHRTEIVPAARGCIFDRNHKTLASNRLCYEIGVCYRDFMTYPAVRAVWRHGKRQKIFPRREKVQALSELISSHIGISPLQVEDFIYSEAALNPAQTVVIKSDIDEKSFYRLKALESQYPGLRVRMGLRRYYPEGALAGHIIGYVGPIDILERRIQLSQLASLQAQLAIEEDPASQQLLYERLEQTREHLRSLDKIIGKAGIESFYETQLRGHDGHHLIHLNARGCSLRQEGESLPVPGKDIHLCIDSELQKLAEELLAQNEQIRDEHLTLEMQSCPQTWVKGGSVIVMDPHTGHVLALASYPRFNPQAFTFPSSNPRVFSDGIDAPLFSKHFWLEDSFWVSGLWDGKWDLWREVCCDALPSSNWQCRITTWRYFLEAACGVQSPIPSYFSRIKSLERAWQIAHSFSQIRESLGKDLDTWAIINFLFSRHQDHPFWPSHKEASLDFVRLRWQQVDAALAIEADKKILEQAVGDLSSNFDKMLLIELCGLLVPEKAFEQTITEPLSAISPEQYRQHTKAYLTLIQELRLLLEHWHQQGPFVEWRKENQKDFLKRIRRLEHSQNQYAKPYLYYLEQERQKQFQQLWNEKGQSIAALLISQSACESDYAAIVEQMDKKIQAHHRSKELKVCIEQLKSAFLLLGNDLFEKYLASMRSFEQLQEPLWANYPLLNHGRPSKRSDLASLIYPKYGLGYMNNKAISCLSPPGSVYKLTIAYEALLQRYQKGYGSWDSLSPFKILDANYRRGKQMIVGKWSSGKEIQQIHRGGRLPKSQRRYIGEIDLLGAIEASSNPYFAILADQELNDAPQDILRASYSLGWGRKTGIDLPFEKTGCLPFDLASNRTGLYTTAIGQHTLLGTPMQAAVMMCAFANGGYILRPKIVDDGQEPDIRGQIELPGRVREYLLEGMRRVVSGTQGSARSASLMSYGPGTNERKIINRMVPYLVGKTSTAEFVEVFGLTMPKVSPKHSNIWFAGIVFDEPLYQGAPPSRVQFHDKQPQLVIVVCLHFGRFGKEAFPIAAMLANRWKQLQRQNVETLLK